MDFFHTHVSHRATDLVCSVMESRKLSEGAMVKSFENLLASQFGLCNPVAVNSGTSAIHLGLILAGVKHGDEVILPAQTFVATGMAVLMCGAKPIFADVDPTTGNIDPKSVAEKMANRNYRGQRVSDRPTAAILPVDWAGLPFDQDEIRAVSGQVVEDAAHALGATYKGCPVGCGINVDWTAFSFQSTKHLTCSDGGAICCYYDRDAERAKKLRWFGIDRNLPTGPLGEREFDIEECGFKYHMNDVAAAIGIGNLEGFENRLKRRQEIGARYRKELVSVPGLMLTRLPTDRTHAYYCFPLLVENRDGFARAMKSKDVPVSIVASRIDRYTVFGGRRDDLPGTDYFDAHQINLPCHEALSDEDVTSVIDSVKGGW